MIKKAKPTTQITTPKPVRVPLIKQPVPVTPAASLIIEPVSSKQNQLVSILKRAEGGTLEEMMNAMGWQRHSIRGIISGVLKKRWGFAIVSAMEERGRVYRIVGQQ